MPGLAYGQCGRLISYSVSSMVVSDSLTSWTVAHYVPLSMGFFSQEYRKGLSFASLGYLPNTGMEPRSPALQAVSLAFQVQGSPCTGCLGCLPI